MPWCDACERFANPNSLTEDGGCPTCGTVIAEADDGDAAAEVAADDEVSTAEALKSIPWHFWLLLAALVLYLGWRLVQGIGWLAGHV